jgi:hypothetical protein
MLCDAIPAPGQTVVTVVPEGTKHTTMLQPGKLPAGLRQYTTIVANLPGTGNSGSGVFDPSHKCLLGIMSKLLSEIATRRDTGKTKKVDLAKYFVPVSTIREFLPPGTIF